MTDRTNDPRYEKPKADIAVRLRDLACHEGCGFFRETNEAADVIEWLRRGFDDICSRLETGEMCTLNDTDIVWFDGITTLWDYCANYCNRPAPWNDPEQDGGTMTDDITQTIPDLPDGDYAIVELLGHRTLVGLCCEVEMFGTKLLRVEPIWQGRLLDPVYHHGSALYGLTPCSKDVALKHAPTGEYQLPAPIRARLLPEQLTAPGGFDFGDNDPDEIPV